MKKNIIDVTGCWIGTVADSSLVQWFDHILFFIFTCCVCIVLAFYVYTFTSDILILLATSTLNKWIVYQNEENNVTPINPCLTSCTRLFDMLFIKIEIRHISNSCKIKGQKLKLNTLFKDIFSISFFIRIDLLQLSTNARFIYILSKWDYALYRIFNRYQYLQKKTYKINKSLTRK